MRKSRVNSSRPSSVSARRARASGGAARGSSRRWIGGLLMLIGVSLIAYSRLSFSTAPKADLVEETGAGDTGLTIPFCQFQDVTAASGIHCRHHSSAQGEKLLPETMGGGSAFLDYDNDGDQDILFVDVRQIEINPGADLWLVNVGLD